LITGAAITGGASVATGVMGNKAQSKAAREQQAAIDKQIAWEREQDEKNRRENRDLNLQKQLQWEAEQAQLAEDRAEERRRDTRDFSESQFQKNRSFAEEQARYQARETRLQPYRQVGTASVQQLGKLASEAGVQLRPVGQGQMTQGLPGAPGAAPMPLPLPPALPQQTMAGLVPR
jgi:hypothetical protein